MAHVMELEAPAKQKTQSAQANAISQRLAQFRATMEFINALPNRRAEAGLGALPDDAIADTYEGHGTAAP